MKHWLLLLVLSLQQCSAFKIGMRRIKCSTPIGGKPTDALLDPRPNIPCVIGYVGAQALLPSLSKCPVDAQIQPPWFNGSGGAGFCPPEYYNLGAVVPGIAIILAALALNMNISSNRLLVTTKGIGTIDKTMDIGAVKQPEEILFKDIDEWNMTPAGLIVKHSSSTAFFPLYWDQKSVEALLDERVA